MRCLTAMHWDMKMKRRQMSCWQSWNGWLKAAVLRGAPPHRMRPLPVIPMPLRNINVSTCLWINSHRRFAYALGTVEATPFLPEYGELEEVGRGGMGIVYRSTHQKMQRIDAIKVIRPDRLTGVSFDTVKQMQHRFEREVRLAAYVAHEHIVPVYQVGEIDGCPWFSMQFVKGTTLNELSKSDLPSTSDLPNTSDVPAPERMAGYIEKIARAVNAVHRHGILHGDIKPHNILIETETDRPLLSDFGLAEFDAYDASTTSTGVAGTLAYMAQNWHKLRCETHRRMRLPRSGQSLQTSIHWERRFWPR